MLVLLVVHSSNTLIRGSRNSNYYLQEEIMAEILIELKCENSNGNCNGEC